MIAETIIPWVLGTFLTLTLIMLAGSVKSWRDMKRSPYFFLRRQAEKRLQTYSSASLVLLFLSAAFAAYAWQSPTDTTYRSALLANAKPPKEEIIALLREETAVSVLPADEVMLSMSATAALQLDGGEAAPAADAEPRLPAEYDRFEPTTDILPDTALGEIAFSLDISDAYEAVKPARIFPEGFYTLYATFSYDDMADGMAWAWVWRHNGKVVDGGNELWAYGDDGPGYIFYGPEEGFQAGEYALEVWVNGELLTAATAVMNSSAALSAGN
ncbi:MAG: hypothetical protein KC425_09090 [Anaerolineales bacterium]|nr:hypothetical protein [Anaerolineales bacterium]